MSECLQEKFYFIKGRLSVEKAGEPPFFMLNFAEMRKIGGKRENPGKIKA